MENMSEWIFDAQFPNSKMGYKIKQELVKRTTPHQELAIYDTYDFGKMLVLDGIVQTTEKDEFIYHEMMAHVAAFCHPHPKQVLVIGGGNGGVVREFLKHKEIDRVVLCEVDAILIQECKTHLPEIAGALGDKRCEVFIGTGSSTFSSTKMNSTSSWWTPQTPSPPQKDCSAAVFMKT